MTNKDFRKNHIFGQERTIDSFACPDTIEGKKCTEILQMCSKDKKSSLLSKHLLKPESVIGMFQVNSKANALFELKRKESKTCGPSHL